MEVTNGVLEELSEPLEMHYYHSRGYTEDEGVQNSTVQ